MWRRRANGSKQRCQTRHRQLHQSTGCASAMTCRAIWTWRCTRSSPHMLRPPVRKVLFVHNGPLYRSDDGGIFGTHYSEAIKQRYLQLGDHVTFLMREARLTGETSRYSRISDDRFSFVPVPNLMSPVGRVLNHRTAMRIIDREVRAADLLVARIPSLTSRLAVARARALRKPVLTECVACNWDALWNHHWKAKLSAPWYYLAQKAVMRESTHSIYVTEDFLQGRYPTKGHSAAISDVDIPAPDAAVLDNRLKHIVTQGEKLRPLRLVTVADVGVRYKGQADVISVLRSLLERGVDAEYHLVGGGDQTRLRTLAKVLGVEERVVFHGALEHARVFGLLDDMDVYVQPSRQEGLPRAMIEAMSRGLPCAGARTGGIPELIPSERIFSPGELGRITEILAALADKGMQAEEARRNFERATAYSRDHLNARRASFYEKFLQEHFS
ncbi:MAG: glycosyltransferase [Rhodobacteraceae bacterium]|nr:MAG: glycosyltransferase [Paracoccaceae bacterium]